MGSFATPNSSARASTCVTLNWAVSASSLGAVASAQASAGSPGSGCSCGLATLVRVTAQALYSGWRDIGSTASLVTALMERYSPNASFQWNGAKQLPGRTRSVITTGNTARPRRDAISMWSPSQICISAASSGWTSTNGPGLSLLSLAILPVLVSVCHWWARRPVLSRNG